MKVKYSNNAASSLNAAVSIGETAMTVVSGVLFPTLDPGDWMYVTVENEVIKVTGISGNIFTCEAFTEDHDVGSTVQGRITAEVLDDAQDTDVYTVPGTLPTDGEMRLGEMWSNPVDNAFGVGDSSGNPKKLIAVTEHSAAAKYFVNDMIVYLGGLYTCLVEHTAAAFNSTNWKDVSPEVPARNLIINGGMQIWQRDILDTYGVAGYHTADRWYTRADVDSLKSSGDPGYNNALALSPNDVATIELTALQGVELDTSEKRLDGKTLTLSFDCLAIGENMNAVASASYVNQVGSTTNEIVALAKTNIGTLIDGVWQRVTRTFTVSVNAAGGHTSLQVEIGANTLAADAYTGDEVLEIRNVKLEETDAATPFVLPDKGLERMKCQEYYWEGFAVGKGYGARYGVSGATGMLLNEIIFPVEMRIVPVVAWRTAPSEDNLSAAAFVQPTTTSVITTCTVGNTGSYSAILGVCSANAEL